MEGIRSRGHDAVLCASASRGGADQIEPAKDHRRGHGLALLERAQTRTEGVRVFLQMKQTRRRTKGPKTCTRAADVSRSAKRRLWVDSSASRWVSNVRL